MSTQCVPLIFSVVDDRSTKTFISISSIKVISDDMHSLAPSYCIINSVFIVYNVCQVSTSNSDSRLFCETPKK